MENIPVHSNNQAHGTHAPQRKGSKNRKMKVQIASVIAVIFLAAVAVGILSSLKAQADNAIDNSKYQAVFLSSGQVYFGKLENSDGQYLKLRDVFYLQTKSATTPENPQTTTTEASDVELIKLGNEIHGPEDEMIISRDQVLFYENLKTDGRVSQSISNYKR
jgi:hypothetical protein